MQSLGIFLDSYYNNTVNSIPAILKVCDDFRWFLVESTKPLKD